MEPITRVEKYLSEIAENTRNGGGSGGGGSESNVLIVNLNAETMGLDKTWQEINDADIAVIIHEYSDDELYSKSKAYVTATMPSERGYMVYATTSSASSAMILTLVAEIADGYPVMDMS